MAIIKNPLVVIGSKEVPTQDKTVALSMAGGDQVITPDTDYHLNRVTVTKPATLIPSNILKDVNIGGVVGSLVVSDVHPQLNAPTLSKSSNTLSISNPSTNGNFNVGFKTYNNGVLYSEITAASLDLTQFEAHRYLMTARCQASTRGFVDSNESNAVDLAVYNIEYVLGNGITCNISTAKTTSGMTLSFTITPPAGKYLPCECVVECNGTKLNYTYNSYTGAVSVSAIDLAYATIGDGSQLDAPYISFGNDPELDIEYSPLATALDIYYENTKAGTVQRVLKEWTITISAYALDTPKLRVPVITLSDQTLSIEPPTYAETIEIWCVTHNDKIYETTI